MYLLSDIIKQGAKFEKYTYSCYKDSTNQTNIQQNTLLLYSAEKCKK